MGDLKVFFHLVILILLNLYPPSLAASYRCPISFCGSNAYAIRFPFRMLGQQPEICGYPGFNLRCNKQRTMQISLPNSGDFSIRSIDYQAQVVQVYDPSGCSVSRLMSLDLLGSPFSGTPMQNYTLLSCPVEVTISRYITVDCLSNSTYSTLATDSVNFATRMANRTACRIIGSVWSPIPLYQAKDGLTTNLNNDISLTWDNPNCQDCVANGGTCGYRNSTMQEIACFENTRKDNYKTMIALIIVSLALAFPTIAATIAMACYICRDSRRVASETATPNVTTATTFSHGDSVIGLDQLTIESYMKVVLGESKRLPGHEDAACSICLAEYDVKEIVRCIPECKHCFHADCIDEWLKMKGTCPVCRNSPSPARVDV
nr:putative RING-H2 finger protein ATL21A [Tanacetum cinerariifolium]